LESCESLSVKFSKNTYDLSILKFVPREIQWQRTYREISFVTRLQRRHVLMALRIWRRANAHSHEGTSRACRVIARRRADKLRSDLRLWAAASCSRQVINTPFMFLS